MYMSVCVQVLFHPIMTALLMSSVNRQMVTMAAVSDWHSLSNVFPARIWRHLKLMQKVLTVICGKEYSIQKKMAVCRKFRANIVHSFTLLTTRNWTFLYILWPWQNGLKWQDVCQPNYIKTVFILWSIWKFWLCNGSYKSCTEVILEIDDECQLAEVHNYASETHWMFLIAFLCACNCLFW